MTLGETLRQMREDKNLTLRDVEQIVGISNAYLCQLENNKIVKPSVHFLHKLAKAYDVGFEELMLAAKYIETAIVRMKCENCGHWTELKTCPTPKD